LLLGEDLAFVSNGSSFAQNVCLDWESWLAVVALPPFEGSSSNKKIEDESEDEPEGILCCLMLMVCESEEGCVLAYLCLLAGYCQLR
jgi:hypothetical protein